MLTFRQIASVVWTFLGFMVAAAVVPNMRYRPLDETNTLLLDTWTGRIQHVAAERPRAEERVVIAESRRNRVDILMLEESARERARTHRHEVECAKVRFAFPAPGSRVPER
jgi:hypothetical protein